MVSHPETTAVVARYNAFHEGLFLLGRVLLAAIFIESGYGKVTNIDGLATTLGSRYALPAPYALAVIGTAVELLSAIAVIVGFKTRWAAAGLLVFMVIATYLAHRYWTYPPDQVMNQYNHFLKNIAIMGGLLILLSTGSSRWSIDRLWAQRS